MPFEKDQHDVDVSAVPETPDADDRPDQEAKPRRRMRWLGIAIAGAVLLLGIVSLLSALSRRGGEPKAADLNTLRSTIASEEEQLRDLQAELDNAEQALADKQAEYDKAKTEAEAGQPDAAGAQRSLDELKADAQKAQETYSEALKAYDESVDAVAAAAPGYDDAKAQMDVLAPYLSYAAAYEQFMSGAADTLPGIENEDPEAEVSAQSWYESVVLPAAQQAGLQPPGLVEYFPAAVQELAAEPSAVVKTYEDALAASKEAEAKLQEANTAQEDAAKAYEDAKNAQKTSADWLADCEAEIARLEKRVADLKDSIEQVTKSLEAHRAELKKLEKQ